MTTLPDGGKAWFVRIRTPTKLKLNPNILARLGGDAHGAWRGSG